jgi:GH25 family lysozyme M1 (1,4-beta-N-acetylmuramidase)
VILGVDLSHFQGRPDFAAIAASGRRFVVLKATEGTSYVDPMFAADRAAAHAAGLIVGCYHFARGGSPAGEASFFLRVVGQLAVGEFVVLDDEVPNVDPAWVQAWCRPIAAATTVHPLVYMNQSTENTGNWAPVIADNDGLWLARYDSNLAQPSGGPWGAPAMKQYTSSGTVAGIAGPVDLDVFFGTDQQLLAFGLHGAQPTPPPPPPPVLEDDMRLVRTPDGTIWKLTEHSMEAEGNLATANALAKAWGMPIVSMEYAEKDAVYLDAYARRNQLLADVQSDILGQVPGSDPSTWLLAQVSAVAAGMKTLQAGGVDPATVAKLVLAGLNGTTLSVTQPA